MEMLLFFVGIPMVFAILQYILTRSGAARRRKWCPAIVVGLILLVCVLGAVEWIPLPETYTLDDSAFIVFPDYWYVGLACVPALVGLFLGAFSAKLSDSEKKEPPV